jgi:hypothetical protein
MANTQSTVAFQPESANVEFEADAGLGGERGGWRAFGGDNFSWNRAAIGVGTVAAVAGAAYAASRYLGRGSSEDERSERLEKESAYT